MTKQAVGALALLTIGVGVYAGNCVKNVTSMRHLRLVCPALYASATERLANTGPLFDKLFEADAALMKRMPDAVVGTTCKRLEDELAWYQWNVGRTVRMDETRALRQQLIAVLDRTLPVCVERATRGIEADDELHRSVASATCSVLKTLRATLDTPVQDASPWVIVQQLDRFHFSPQK